MANLIVDQQLSQLVLIDMQAKLASVMPADALQGVVKNCSILAQTAKLLVIPAIVTEQYPQGLGESLPEIKQHLADSKFITKTAFSACGEPKFNQQLHRDKPQIVLAGMEAHICVLQTVLDLTKANKQVFVVEDAIISRNPANKANAIARMRDAGCVISNTESVMFEWLGNANHDAFKAVSKLIR
jgi:nicotinamidase-related amidase